jgi:hypothetical protein
LCARERERKVGKKDAHDGSIFMLDNDRLYIIIFFVKLFAAPIFVLFKVDII